MFVKPAEGLSIIDPSNNTIIPVEGQEVPDDSYWVRRVRDGDVTVADNAKEPDGHTEEHNS